MSKAENEIPFKFLSVIFLLLFLPVRIFTFGLHWNYNGQQPVFPVISPGCRLIYFPFGREVEFYPAKNRFF
jgi:hypothetical protein